MPISWDHPVAHELRKEMVQSMVDSVRFSYVSGYASIPAQWDTVFKSTAMAIPSLPVSLPVAVAIGVAGVIVKNPTVTRRFTSWFLTPP